MDEPSRSSGRLLGVALCAALALGVLYALYCMLLFAGPYRWFAELQLGWFDSYYVSLTCAFTLLSLSVPQTVALRVLAMSGKLHEGSFAALIAAPRTGARLRAVLARARRWLIVAGVGLVLSVLSVRDLVVAGRGQTLERLSAAALERGIEPRSTWLQVDGRLHWDAALETEERGKQRSYIPVVSESWTPKHKVGALVVVEQRDVGAVDARAIAGTLDVTGVPGMVRAAYEDMQLDVQSAVLLEFGEGPAEKAASGKFLLSIGLVLLVIGGFGILVRMR